MPTINLPTAAKQDQILTAVQSSGSDSSNNTTLFSNTYTTINSTNALSVNGAGKIYSAVLSKVTDTANQTIKITIDGNVVINLSQPNAAAASFCGMVSNSLALYSPTTFFPLGLSNIGTTPIGTQTNWTGVSPSTSVQSSTSGASIVYYIPTYLSFKNSLVVNVSSTGPSRLGIVYSLN